MNTAAWIAVAAVVIIVLAVIDARRKRAATSDRPFFDIEGGGDYDVEVVGESHYQSALYSCVTGNGYVRQKCIAKLVCEDDNRHDPNAVRIEIDAKLVGYLPRASAVAYREFLASNRLGIATGVAKAIICGGGGKSYGVWIDM